MSTSIQSTLLGLMQQVIEDPDRIPILPLDVWSEGTEQQHLLTGFRDMLERLQQHYQDKLEAQERFSLAVQGANDGLWDQHFDTGEYHLSTRWKSMLGYEDDEISDTVDEWLKRVHPDDMDRVLEAGQDYREGRTNSYELEYRLQHKDDSYRWVFSRGTALRDASGKPYRMAGSNTDITSTRLTGEQLREKEEQYRSIFEASSDGLYIIDLDGFVVEANPAAHKQLGYTYEELIGMHRSTFLHPDYRSLVPEYLQVIQAGDQFQGRAVDVRKDGTLFPVEVRGKAFTYKGQPHTLSVVRDITRQVEAEQQLRDREEQYRGIFEATYDGVIITDLNGFFVEANPAFCSMYGYTREELIGLHSSVLTAPASLPTLADALKTFKTGEAFQTVGQSMRKDGTVFYVEGRGMTFTFKGKPHALSAIRDITERVEAEQQLREREEQYRAVFEATTDGLIISNLRGLIIEANPAACKMYGYAYEEFVGLHGTDITSLDTHFLLTEALQTIRTDSKSLSSIRATGLRKDGTLFPTEGYGTRIMYKGKPHILAVVRDITEQVRAEEQLREKEEQYRSIFEATTDGLIIRDMDGFVVEANPAAYTMHDYAYQEFLGLHRSDIIAPEDHSMVAEYMKAIQAGRSFRGQAVDLRKDGSAFPVEVRGSLFTFLGKPHTLSVLRDISERVQAEQQLREKEEQYRSIFEATNDGLDILDPDGFIVEANPAFCSMFGYTREELIGLFAGKLTAPQSRHLVEESRESIKEGRDIQVEGLSLRKDGSIFHAEAHLTALIYQGKPHMLGVTRDITGRVEAEKQLREKEEQYRNIFEATSDALLIRDLEDGHVVEANPAACQMYGYSYEEFIGLAANVITHPDSLRLLPEGLQIVQAGHQLQFQGLGLRKDGTPIHVEMRGTPFTYKGKPHVLGVSRDITEQVQAQHLLEQRVEERTRELSSLLEISHTVASTLQLKPLLSLILDQLQTVVDYTGASILTLEGDGLVFLDHRGPVPEEQLVQLRFPLKHLGLIWESLIAREPILIENVHRETPLAQAFRATMDDLLQTTFGYICAWMAVPLQLKDQVIGMLVLASKEEGAFTQHHAALALAIANQAAIAIENARLYEQAQELAAVEERQRLARELHDSVSQALYGISLGVHTARLQLDHDRAELTESLDYVLELAEAALMEMRALIFELRPESLETEGLVTALTKQATALQARQSIAVHTDLCAEPHFPLKIKQELYRVAQEALHNTVKHAGASRVDLRLGLVDGMVMLEVRDNGKGFDATASFPGHLGLHSMRERVKSLGGELQIQSTPGQGTSIRAQVPV